MKFLRHLFVLAAVWPLVGCSSAPPAVPSFTVELRATSEDGTPLPGVGFTLGKRAASHTNADGTVIQQVPGVEGSSVKIVAACPAEFESPVQPEPLRLTRTRAIEGQGAQPLTVEVRCQKRLSDVVVVVHAERGERLPLLIDGKPVATTDDEGIAHVLLRRPRADKSLQLGIDSTTRPGLKPANPSRTFELGGRDAVVLFEPSFVVAAPPVARRAAPQRRIPVRVD